MMMVEVSKLQALIDPFVTTAWPNVPPINLQDVEQALLEPGEPAPYSPTKPWSYQQHCQRIANLIQSGWTDPIVVDFTYPPIIFDGLHRLAAAIYQKSNTIWSEVYGPKEKISKLY